MFASLKNKIKEETGNDPTARVPTSESRRRSRTDDQAIQKCVSYQHKAGPSTSDSNQQTLASGTSSSIEDLVEKNILSESPNLRGHSDLNHGPDSTHNNKEKNTCEQVLDERSTVVRKTSDDASLPGEHYTNGEEHRSTDDFKKKIQYYLKETDQRGLQDYLLCELEKLNIPNNTDHKMQKMELQLIEAKHQAKEANKLCELLTQDLTAERSVNAGLKSEVGRLREELTKQTRRVDELGSSLERELQEKDVILLRNAQLNQNIEMSKQESRNLEQDTLELESRLSALETTIVQREEDLARQVKDNKDLQKKIGEIQSTDYLTATEQELRRKVAALEEQLAEKVKSIRVLQQHLTDLKKTLQRELKQNGEESADSPATLLTAMPTKHAANSETDVNFKYLKHVIMKFLTSREYEAQHLTRAVSTLLRFTPEEERLLRDTLEWKMSWFGTRPRLGYGQTSKTIPPS